MSKPSRTTFIALTVLHDAISRARVAPLKPPEHGVRLALVYLWSITLSKNREPFDGLWRVLMDKAGPPLGGSRTTASGTQMARIYREIGLKPDIDAAERDAA